MIAIVDYDAGNTRSVQNALSRIGGESILTDDPTLLKSAEKIIFPGVGEASTAMQKLRDKGLDEVIRNLTQPFLGICLGMQLMCRHSEEGNTPCLGVFDVNVKRFPNTDIVPHMGWNTLDQSFGTLLQGINEKDDLYFVHSYYVESNPYSIADANYILPFCAAMQNKNFFTTQFHPEKSSNIGSKILKNFLSL